MSGDGVARQWLWRQSEGSMTRNRTEMLFEASANAKSEQRALILFANDRLTPFDVAVHGG